MLTEGFRDLLELHWSEFCEQEKQPDITNYQTIIHTLVRACRKGNLRAIQSALNRIDGKVAQEIQIELPKFYTLYPYAEEQLPSPALSATESERTSIIDLPAASPADMDELTVAEDEQPTGSLRVSLEQLLNSPKELVDKILLTADRVEVGNLTGGDPMVKSVIVAGLMKLVHNGRFAAVEEVLDQIDGKVKDTIKLLGGDVYLTSYDTIAPSTAIRNQDGVYQTEATQITTLWGDKLDERRQLRG